MYLVSEFNSCDNLLNLSPKPELKFKNEDYLDLIVIHLTEFTYGWKTWGYDISNVDCVSLIYIYIYIYVRVYKIFEFFDRLGTDLR